MSTTDDRTLVGGVPTDKGYRQLEDGQGEHRIRRTELMHGAHLADTTPRETLLVAAHLADLHVCDAQSPARAEFIDRYADPDSPVKEYFDQIGSYRSNEILTAQVAAAMVDAVNSIATGPVTGAKLELAVITGDNTDNGQLNELEWYLKLLEGGEVVADSGDLTRYEGVADADHFDENFWHPEADKNDLPKAKYGFPTVPGLLAAVRRPFTSDGLGIPWLAVHGNHDQMIQGYISALEDIDQVPVGNRKPIAMPEDWTLEQIVQLVSDLRGGGEAVIALLRNVAMREVAADPKRRIASLGEFVEAHFSNDAKPLGHGFSASNRDFGSAYYRFDQGSVTFLVLDTVNPEGHWEGSLDQLQGHWLETELAAADADQRYVIVASHHPLFCLTNDRAGSLDAEPRLLEGDVEAMLARHRCVIGWFNGHTHTNRIVPHGSTLESSWWEITAPSLIDWPQQARIVELSRCEGGQLRFDCTGIDHAGLAPWTGAIDSVAGMAGLSRELSANDWQGRRNDFDNQPRSGLAEDRNVTLFLPDPFA